MFYNYMSMCLRRYLVGYSRRVCVSDATVFYTFMSMCLRRYLVGYSTLVCVSDATVLWIYMLVFFNGILRIVYMHARIEVDLEENISKLDIVYLDYGVSK